MKITVLGSGTSTGVPVPACRCSVCTSEDPYNKRLRTSIIIHLDESDGVELPANRPFRSILFDTSTDFRYQALRAEITAVDCVLFTHTHADHIFGLDDLRSFNFVQKSTIPLYASKEGAAELRRIFSYTFNPDPNYLGGALPKLELREFTEEQPLNLFGLEVYPIPVLHGRQKVYGFRIKDFAYITDCSEISDSSREMLKGVKHIILDGLRDRPHRTHFSFEQAIKELELIEPEKAFLIHMTHEVDHGSASQSINDRTPLDVSLAYDGLEFYSD